MLILVAGLALMTGCETSQPNQLEQDSIIQDDRIEHNTFAAAAAGPVGRAPVGRSLSRIGLLQDESEFPASIPF